jgi:anti-sigma factor RsiW
MTCAEFEAQVQAYVDGELSVEQTAGGDAHAAGCGQCAALARRERANRLLLRRQPREAAPAELTSDDPSEIAAWFRQRAGLHMVVPDYSSAGIRLVGARLADAHERGAAYLLYEKGHVIMSVFMLPLNGKAPALGGTRIAHRGHEYRRYEQKGYRTVFWTDGRAVYGLISMLDYDALLECADRLRSERARA